MSDVRSGVFQFFRRTLRDSPGRRPHLGPDSAPAFGTSCGGPKSLLLRTKMDGVRERVTRDYAAVSDLKAKVKDFDDPDRRERILGSPREFGKVCIRLPS